MGGSRVRVKERGVMMASEVRGREKESMRRLEGALL